MAQLQSEQRIISAARCHDRDGLLVQLLQALSAPSLGHMDWGYVMDVARHLGEIDIALEAGRRHSLSQPNDLNRRITYWKTASNYGREEEVLSQITALPSALRNDERVMMLRGGLEFERGDFDAAERLFRKLATSVNFADRAWLAISKIKHFASCDPDLTDMVAALLKMPSDRLAQIARLNYAYAKALDDIGEFDRALGHYREGARLRGIQHGYGWVADSHFVRRLIEDFDDQGLCKLLPSGFTGQNVVIVNSLPRSGSTLVEQMLGSHSSFCGGGEVDLFPRAALSVGPLDFQSALQFQSDRRRDDPWGEIATIYHRLLAQRFGGNGLCIDKTAVQSRLIGLMLHSMPEAKVVWVRRRPDDTAWSCFSTFFSAPVQWSWSMADIGHFFHQEDLLYAHWTMLFPDRILTVPYEGLVADIRSWMSRIIAFLDLPEEDVALKSGSHHRFIKTASARQIRDQISSNRIGRSLPYSAALEGFWNSYQAA